jgi:hypothetical protein
MNFQRAYNGSNLWLLFDGHDYKGYVHRVIHRKKILRYTCYSHPNGGCKIDVDGSVTLNEAKLKLLNLYRKEQYERWSSDLLDIVI